MVAEVFQVIRGVCNLGKCSTDNLAFRYTYALTSVILFVLSIINILGYVSNAKMSCSKMSEATKEELDVFCSTSSNALFVDLNVDWSGNSRKSIYFTSSILTFIVCLL
jgi:hypothetical protein